MKRTLLPILSLSALALCSCAPTTRASVSASPAPVFGCQPVTGIAVQSVFDGDYGGPLSNLLTKKLTEAGYKAYKSSDYPDVNAASINIVGMIDHWADQHDQALWRVGTADLQVVDRHTNIQLARFQTRQGGAFFALSLPEYTDSLVSEIKRRYCQA